MPGFVMIAGKNILYGMLAFALVSAIILNNILGLLFFAMVVAYFLTATQRDAIPFSKGKSFAQKGIIAIVIGGAIFFIAGSFISGHPFNVLSVIKLFGTTALSNLSLDNPIIRFIIWGIFIPIAESMFFLGFIGGILKKAFKATGNKIDSKKMAIMATVGSVSVISHIVSQGVVDATLLLDFLFFGVSMGITFYSEQLQEATFLHIGVNSLKILMGG